jgi:hypothetical protein
MLMVQYILQPPNQLHVEFNMMHLIHCRVKKQVIHWNCVRVSEVEIYACYYCVPYVINSENKEIKEEIVGEATTKGPRLGEQQSDWQWKKSMILSPNNIYFPQNNGSIKSVSRASETYKLYFGLWSSGL